MASMSDTHATSGQLLGARGELAQRGRRLRQRCRVAAGDGYLCARLGECQGDFATNAAVAARDEGHPTGEIERYRHGLPPYAPAFSRPDTGPYCNARTPGRQAKASRPGVPVTGAEFSPSA